VHILYFHQHFITLDGAGSVRSYRFALALKERGHDVTIVCGSYAHGSTGLHGSYRKGRRTGTVDGIQVIELELSYSNHDNFTRRTLQFLRFAMAGIGSALRGRYDLLFATSTPLTVAIPGIAAKLFRHKPFVFEVRDLWPELPREMGVITNPLVLGLMSALEWSAYHAADHVVGLAPGIAEGITRRGISESRISVISNGCDLEQFDKVEPSQPPEAARFGFWALFGGAHGIANGLDAVLDAAAVLKARGRNDIGFILAGDGKLKHELMARVAKERIDTVVFLDPIPKHRFIKLIRGAGVGLQILSNVPAFYRGTSPNKFFDYIAAGRPVLINYPGWLADLVTSESCGVVVPPDNPAAFADAIERLADDPEGCADMGRRARALAEKSFARDQLANRLVNLLENCKR
jgi:glycosyltransferase involved in cell wall biosynthesis